MKTMFVVVAILFSVIFPVMLPVFVFGGVAALIAAVLSDIGSSRGDLAGVGLSFGGLLLTAVVLIAVSIAMGAVTVP